MEKKPKFKLLSENSGLIGVALLLFIVLSILIPSFCTLRNILTLGKQISIIGIAAIGITFVTISGGRVDLSIGSNISLSAIICCLIMTSVSNEGTGIALGILAAIMLGMLIGLINGTMVAIVGVNPFIATVVTQMLFEGIALYITEGQSIGNLPKAFTSFAKLEILNISVLIYIFVIFIVLGQYALRKNTIGKIIYAVGSNKTAAQLVGISTQLSQTLCYVFSGFCGGLAGVLLASRMSSATNAMGSSVKLDIVSAVIVGGASIGGGKGTVIGTTLGVIIIGLIGNAINLTGLSHNLALILKGSIILGAIVLDFARENIARKRMLAK